MSKVNVSESKIVPKKYIDQYYIDKGKLEKETELIKENIRKKVTPDRLDSFKFSV